MKPIRPILLAACTALALSACLPPPHHGGPHGPGDDRHDHRDRDDHRGDHGDHDRGGPG